jgi:hypothetical protein
VRFNDRAADAKSHAGAAGLGGNDHFSNDFVHVNQLPFWSTFVEEQADPADDSSFILREDNGSGTARSAGDTGSRAMWQWTHLRGSSAANGNALVSIWYKVTTKE